MPEEFGEHLTRDQRTIPSSRISPDPSDHSSCGASSLQFTSHIFYRVQVRGLGRPWQKFLFCSVTRFCVDFDVCFGLLSWLKIQPLPMIRFLTEAVGFRIFYLLVFDGIHVAMHLTRYPGPPAEKQAHNIKDPAVYLTVGMGYFLSLFVLNPSGGSAAKKLFFQFHLTLEASAIWSSSRVWQLNMLEFVFGWARRIFLETLPNNMWWCRGLFDFFFLGFLTPRLKLISAILQLWSLESLWLHKLSSSRCIGTI